MARIVIVGGGVIGCAVAERLTRERRHQVLLLERDAVGAHASGAAAGLLTPYSEGGQDLSATRSLAMFPELVERVERSGIAVEYRDEDSLTPALTGEEERRLRRGPGRWLDADQARAAEPGLSQRVHGAAVFREAQVTPIRLVRALVRTAAAQGAEIREGAPVGGLTVRAGRLQGVQTAEGPVKADVVVVAAGPWSPALASPLGVALHVRPNRGQLVTLRPRGAALRHLLTWRGSYLVPKPDGTVVAGSTEEDAGFDDRPTAEGVAGLLEFACRAVPALGAAVVERVWAALRPATPDGEPVIGPTSEVPNLVVATGHNRNGILLAPITAELVAQGLP
ncbi:MAG TPA: glycine oxidase ThiO [Candidatus Dormibacteraeota bacterium]|nr:glycine oxidase ThiO [Candidatus Dormibacteraeota bacterium]